MNGTGGDLRCRAGRQCIARTSDGPAVTTRDTLCHRCIDDIERRLGELPHLADALYTFLGGSTKTAQESRVSRTSVPSAPMNVHIDAMLGEIQDVIDRTNGLHIKDLVSQPAELFNVWVKDVEQKKYLDGPQRALDVRRVHEKALAYLGLEPVWTKRHSARDECGLRTLGSWSGTDYIECMNCGTRKPLEEVKY